MVDRVVLHIGTMKSGTSYLQRVLETGVLENVDAFYAGGAFRAQSRAVDGLPLITKRGGGRAWRGAIIPPRGDRQPDPEPAGRVFSGARARHRDWPHL